MGTIHSIFSLSNHFATHLPFLREETPSNTLRLPENAVPSYAFLNHELSEELSLSEEELETLRARRFFVGDYAFATSPQHKPVVQGYAGHQFGYYSSLLGDGRAMLLGELNHDGKLYDLHLKGSGPTPFARRGDGKALLGPMLREYICSIFFHKVGIPTTRSLAVLYTSQKVMRDHVAPGATLVRVASSHIRIGSFQLVRSYNRLAPLKQLALYVIERHYPELNTIHSFQERIRALFSAVSKRQLSLLAKWNGIGFVHGVMNTDNILISGETLDFGPCAFIDQFDYDASFSSIDREGRYAYSNQYNAMFWNLARFSETLLPLMLPIDYEHYDDHYPITQLLQDHSKEINSLAESIVTELHELEKSYEHFWRDIYRQKLGLLSVEDSVVSTIANQLLDIMHEHQLDYTLTFYQLCEYLKGSGESFDYLFKDKREREVLKQWRKQWMELIENKGDSIRAMEKVNPLYIPRNHHLEEALLAAEEGDLSPFKELLSLIKRPYLLNQASKPESFLPTMDRPPFISYCGT